MRLYDIDQELFDLLAAIEENDGELDGGTAELLELNEQQLADKAEGYAMAIKSFGAESAALATEIKRLQGRKATTDNRVNRLKSCLVSSMQTREIKKMSAGIFNLSVKASDSVEILDFDLLVPIYIRVTTAPDKTAIKASIKAGNDVAGASIVTNYSLGVK